MWMDFIRLQNYLFLEIVNHLRCFIPDNNSASTCFIIQTVSNFKRHQGMNYFGAHNFIDFSEIFWARIE